MALELIPGSLPLAMGAFLAIYGFLLSWLAHQLAAWTVALWQRGGADVVDPILHGQVERHRLTAEGTGVMRTHQLIVTLADELRHPLTSMRMAVEVMLKRIGPEPGERARNVIVRQLP